MKKTLCVFLALFLALSLLSVPALAAEGDSSFEPVTVADDETVKIVVTDLVNSPETSSASFTLEITNKTEMGLEFSLTAFSANDRMCPLSWIGDDPWAEDFDLPSGETVSISAGWDKPSLAQVGVNYVQSADGYLSAKWSSDYYMEQYDAAGDDADARMAVDDQYYAFKLLVPFSLPIPAVEMDVPATEEVIYDTDFEPVTIMDNEDITAVIHDYYFNHDHFLESDREIGPSLVISIENRTGEMLRPNIPATVDGVAAFVNSSTLLPPGKTMIEAMNFAAFDANGPVELTSVDNIDLDFALDGYGGGFTNVKIDVTPYADVTSSIHGTAAWVADPTPPEPTEEAAEEDASSAEAENADLIWAPDPEADADATVTLGDNGEYRIGMSYDESFPAIILYFENNSNNATDFYTRNVMVNGSSFPYSFGYLSSGDIIQPGGAANYLIVEEQTAFPSDGFESEIELRFTGEDSNILLDTTVTVSFAEDGSATIEQVS